MLVFSAVPNRKILILVASGAMAAACGSSPTGPTTTPTPVPTPGVGYDLVGQVFVDANGNGVFDAGEETMLPAASVQVGGRTGKADPVSGRVVVSDVPGGSYTGGLVASSLPPFYQPGKAPTFAVPQPAGQDVPFAVTLPIGSNRPFIYMGFGDSITNGDGSSDGDGYRRRLTAKLEQAFGQAAILNEGIEGTQTLFGRQRLPGTLAQRRPAYTLILYGTNDWNLPECKNNLQCGTVNNLQAMIESVKGAQSLPIVATIIPANPAFPTQVPPERNQWVHNVDGQIRTMAQQEGAVIADLEAVFLKQPDLTRLFSDHVHPNDAGYELMAAEWFRAITTPAVGGSSFGRSSEGARRLAPLLDITPRPLRPLAPIVPAPAPGARSTRASGGRRR